MMAPCPAAWSAQEKPPWSQAPSRAPLGIVQPMAQLKSALISQALPQPRPGKKRLRPVLLGNEGPGLKELRGAPGLTHCSPLSSHCVLEGNLVVHPAVCLLKLSLDLRDVLLLSPGPTVESSPHPS